MEFFTEHLFLSGIIVGFVPILYLILKHMAEKHKLNANISQLKNHLHTQMEITQKGNEKLLQERDVLKKKNENLRISLQAWQQKTGKADIRLLHQFDKAIHILLQRTPGFAPVWENALAEAEEDLKQSDKGVKALVRKVFSPTTFKPQADTAPLLEKYMGEQGRVMGQAG